MIDLWRNRVGIISLLALDLALFWPPGAAAEWSPREGEVSRRVLGIVNYRELKDGDLFHSSLFAILQKPLNQLGFVVDYADPDQPLPDFRRYRAIVVWMYSYEMNEAERFLPWLLEAMKAGVKLILPSGLGLPVDANGETHGEAQLAEIHSRLGLDEFPKDKEFSFEKIRITYLKPENFFYETGRFREITDFPVFHAGKGAEVWQRIENIDDPDIYAVSVILSSAGFWSLATNMIYHSLDVARTDEALEPDFRLSWNLNPWNMLREALDCRGMPAPDVTTYSGARGAYAHVDADGPYNLSQPDVPGPPRYAIDVMLNEVWEKYDFPVTVGLISAEFDPDSDLRFSNAVTPVEKMWDKPRPEYLPSQREVAGKLREYAGEIFKLPHVQPGCHAYTHPLDWYDLFCGYAIPGYRPNYEMEIRGAVEYLNRNVLPPGKPVELFQWSGDCKPPPGALAVLDGMGMENINGGDPLYDNRHDSIYYVCPLSIQKGNYHQVFISACNENIYTEEWTGFKGAYNNVITTFERSESPIRLLPVNIYYHVFPAEVFAGLKAIQNVYEWAKRRELCWITALEYVRAAKDFLEARIGRTGDGGWWIEDYDSCRTVRFDLADRVVDMETSRNVAGFVRHNDSLYVSLLPGERAEIRLTPEMPSKPCLARASGLIRNVEAKGDRWRAECRSWSRGFVELWAPGGKWRASATIPGGRKISGKPRRLDDGRLRFEFPGGAGEWINIVFEK